MSDKNLELLAPAKNLEYGKIAINFGADAVYIGAPKFGARAVVGNSIQDIEKLCNYAHKFHSKVFVALNTILYENELVEAERIIHQIYNAGADALIIQDMGILEENLPPITLHVSTQAHNIDYKKINFYKKIGFERVIIARELSLSQIQEINQNTNIELEAFVHGALCVSYSGQCYMSAYIGNRSGNRGECAQTCRLKYDLLDANKNIIVKNKHLLSLKDMNRSANILQMIEAGVTSFKIEGRLKNQTYVKNVTAYYRKVLYDIIENNQSCKQSSIGKFDFDFEPDLENTFNRRYSDYFLTGRKPEMTSNSPKSVGKPLGRVKNYGKKFIEIDTNLEIANGDGLCFFNKKDELVGFNVNKSVGNKIFFSKKPEIEKGTLVYRNNDLNFSKLLDKIENCRFIPVDIEFRETDLGFSLKISTVDGIYSVEKELKIEKELAKNKNSIDNIKKQLSKTGNTIFKVNKLDVEIEKSYFIPISKLNRIRRKALEKLYENLGDKHIILRMEITKNNVEYLSENLDYKANISNSLSDKFYKRHGVKKIESAFELVENKSEKVIMTTKLCIKYNLGQCPIYQKSKKNSCIKYLKLENHIFELEFDCKKCEMKIKTEKL